MSKEPVMRRFVELLDKRIQQVEFELAELQTTREVWLVQLEQEQDAERKRRPHETNTTSSDSARS